MTDAPAENQPDPDPAADDSDTEQAAPTSESDSPLRPVDWDGSFNYASNARMDEEWSQQRAARQEREWDEKSLRRMNRELLDRLLAEKEAAGRATEASEHRGPEHPGDARSASGEDRPSLFDRLENFGRPANGDDATRPEDSGDPR